MKKNILNILWFITVILTILSIGYHLSVHSTESTLLASGLISLFMLLEIYRSQIIKRTSIGMGRRVYKYKDPKAFKAYLMWYGIICFSALIVFVYNIFTLIK
jgi:hypothetical protein